MARYPKLSVRLSCILVVMTVLCVWLGVQAKRCHNRERAAEELHACGVRIGYSQTDPSLTFLRKVVSVQVQRGDLNAQNPEAARDQTDRVFRCLGRLPELKRLDLNNLHINDAHLVQLNRLQGLEELYLGGECRTTDRGLACLQAPRLEELRLETPGISNESMRIIAGFRHLKRLHVVGNRVTDEGLLYLTSLNRLECLTLWTDEPCTVSQDALDALLEALPRCVVWRRAVNGEIVASSRANETLPTPDVVTMAKRLEQGDADAFESAVCELREMGADARRAVPILIQALKNKDPMIRRAAVEGLRHMGRNADRAIAALVQTLRDRDVGLAASFCLEQMGVVAVPALIETMRSEDPFVRTMAAKALCMGPEAQSAVPALVDGLRDEDPEVRSWCSVALSQIGAPAVPALEEALRNIDPTVRGEAVDSLSVIGPDAETAIPLLTEMLRDENEGVRLKAAIAIGRIDTRSWGSVPLLVDMLDEDHVRYVAAIALAQLNPPVDSAVGAATDVLVAALKADSENIRVAAANALGRTGSATKPVQMALSRALEEDRSQSVRTAAAAALAEIGADAATAVPTLP